MVPANYNIKVSKFPIYHDNMHIKTSLDSTPKQNSGPLSFITAKSASTKPCFQAYVEISRSRLQQMSSYPLLLSPPTLSLPKLSSTWGLRKSLMRHIASWINCYQSYFLSFIPICWSGGSTLLDDGSTIRVECIPNNFEVRQNTFKLVYCKSEIGFESLL